MKKTHTKQTRKVYAYTCETGSKHIHSCDFHLPIGLNQHIVRNSRFCFGKGGMSGFNIHFHSRNVIFFFSYRKYSGSIKIEKKVRPTFTQQKKKEVVLFFLSIIQNHICCPRSKNKNLGFFVAKFEGWGSIIHHPEGLEVTLIFYVHDSIIKPSFLIYLFCAQQARIFSIWLFEKSQFWILPFLRALFESNISASE